MAPHVQRLSTLAELMLTFEDSVDADGKPLPGVDAAVIHEVGARFGELDAVLARLRELAAKLPASPRVAAALRL